MSERFVRLFSLQKDMYLVGCPVYIQAGALLKDNATNDVLVQLKLCNLYSKRLISCKVTVESYETNGALLETVTDFEFMDINRGIGESFGSKTPIFLNNNRARKFDVCVTEVVYSDGTVQNYPQSKWGQLPQQTSLSSYFGDDRFVEQYKIELGENCRYVPYKDDFLFLCSCGEVNLFNAVNCNKCYKTYNEQYALLDKEVIESKLTDRLVREKAEKERIEREQEENRKKRKKKIIRGSIIAAVLCIVAILSYATPKYVIPSCKKMITYHQGNKLLSEGQYDEAKTVFESISEYKDSEQMILETQYKHAEALAAEGTYDDAIKIWKNLGEYKDSKDQIEKAKEKEQESKYQEAVSLMNQGDYQEAKQMFSALTNYKDSNEKAKECSELKKAKDYQTAIELYNAEDYGEAVKLFQDLKGYNKSVEMFNSSAYKYAAVLKEQGEYVRAIGYLEKCPDYADAAELKKAYAYEYAERRLVDGDKKGALEFFDKALQYKDAQDRRKALQYEIACSLYDDGDYYNAIKGFNKCRSYKDSEQKILDAEYNYVVKQKHTDATNYIKHLIDSNYPGAKNLKTDLFNWEAQVKFTNKSGTSISSVSTSSYLSVDITIKDGAQSPLSMKVTAVVTYPNGYVETVKWIKNEPMSKGSQRGFCWENGCGTDGGTLKCVVKDESGRIIGSNTISVY